MSDSPPFTAVASKIGRLLASANVDPLAVPKYQREYAWTVDEVEKMLRDFSRAQRANPLSPDYFLGSIVMSSGRPIEVIDGQQRLATTAIVIAGIRNALDERGCRKEAEAIHLDYLVRKSWSEGESVLPRLTLNKNDKGFFWNEVICPPWESTHHEPEPRHESHTAIRAAKASVRQWFDDELKQAGNKSDVINICKKWIDQLTDNVTVAAITAVNRREAFRIFATLNDRGLRVTQADLVKSHLFEVAARADEHSESFEIIENAWSSTRTTLDVIQEEGILVDYIRHFLQLRNGVVREDEIYERTEDEVTSEPLAVSFAESLSATASRYAAIHSSSHHFWKNENGVDKSAHRRIMDELVCNLRLKYHRVLLLACCCKMTSREVLRALEFIRSLSVRMLCCGGTRSGKTESAIAKAAQAVFSGTITTAADLAVTLKEINHADTAFRNAFAVKRFGDNAEARYFLMQIENYLRRQSGHGTEVSDDPNVTNLEHILPKGNVTKMSAGNWAHFDADAKKAYCTRIGNMALALNKANSTNDQDAFPAKRAGVLSQGSFLSNKWFLQYTSATDAWNPDQIESRQSWLADLAPKVWPQ